MAKKQTVLRETKIRQVNSGRPDEYVVSYFTMIEGEGGWVGMSAETSMSLADALDQVTIFHRASDLVALRMSRLQF